MQVNTMGNIKIKMNLAIIITQIDLKILITHINFLDQRNFIKNLLAHFRTILTLSKEMKNTNTGKLMYLPKNYKELIAHMIIIINKFNIINIPDLKKWMNMIR